jgi:multidrug efflux pump subunit AcrA (membrane-fusion protein)
MRPRPALLLSAPIVVLLACGGSENAPSAPTAEATRGRIERIVVATGTIEPAVEVEVRPRIAGIIEKIHVEAGDEVEPGQPLVEIERELLVSQVHEAEAAVREARVELRYAKRELERALELERTGAASPQHGDTARNRHERASAAVARASAVAARLSTEIGYATVRSTLRGRVLDVPVEEGNAVSPVTAPPTYGSRCGSGMAGWRFWAGIWWRRRTKRSRSRRSSSLATTNWTRRGNCRRRCARTGRAAST